MGKARSVCLEYLPFRAGGASACQDSHTNNPKCRHNIQNATLPCFFMCIWCLDHTAQPWSAIHATKRECASVKLWSPRPTGLASKPQIPSQRSDMSPKTRPSGPTGHLIFLGFTSPNNTKARRSAVGHENGGNFKPLPTRPGAISLFSETSFGKPLPRAIQRTQIHVHWSSTSPTINSQSPDENLTS